MFHWSHNKIIERVKIEGCLWTLRETAHESNCFSVSCTVFQYPLSFLYFIDVITVHFRFHLNGFIDIRKSD